MRYFVLTVVLAMALLPAPATAITYDVRALLICPDTTNCADDDKILGKFERVNKRWAPMGVTFRPTVERMYNATYAEIVDGDSPGVADLHLLAQADPERITFFIIQGGNFKCWAGPPQNYPAGSAKPYSLFCYSQITGVAFAHELGHYFCLPHTFTFQDPATHRIPNHDGDNLADTLPDPGLKETGLINKGGPDDGAAREWCKTTDLDDAFTDVVFEVTNYPGEAKVRGCTVACERSTATGIVPTAFTPLGENGMAYYFECFGPWTHDGVRHEYFLPDQAQRVQQCIANEPERAALVDVCAGDADSDGDGLCDADDACPLRAALVGMDRDTDSDGVVDGCDTCPDFPGPGTDTDGDGYCDAIDADDDGDTCKDAQDYHPLDATVVVGHRIGDRPACSGPIHAWEGTTGPSGLPLCRIQTPPDIDGDGVLNAADPCLLEPGLGCYQTVSCPLPPPHWKLICALGGCNQFELVAVEVSNPGVVLARSPFQIANDVIYAQSASGLTLLETARTFAGQPPPPTAALPMSQTQAVTTKSARSPRMRFEIRRRDGSVAATVAELDAPAIRLGPRVHGSRVVLRPAADGRSLQVDVSWGVAIAPGERVPDGDGDAIADAWDNCSAVANRDQYDGDGDGYGNACDPDLDQDGRVGAADLARLRASIGSVGETVFLGEGEDGGVDYLDERAMAVEFDAAADLDGDGQVTAIDERLWSSLRLGPSGYRR